MPRMILLNGPPSCGKSTLARRYAQEHPLSLNLDVDRIRDLIGGWQDAPHGQGCSPERSRWPRHAPTCRPGTT
jgi:predicted kinase